MRIVEILEMPNGVEKARAFAISGLLTDGGWHKQWYLERILESLDVNLRELWITLVAEGYDWEAGIAP